MSSSISDMKIAASQIKEATKHGENTALRVGGLLVEMVDYLDTLHNDEITLGPLLTALNNSNLVDPADGQTLTFSILEDNWTFSSAITQLKIAQKGIESTVASNYQVFLEARTSLQNQIDTEDQKIRDNYSEYFTWKTQTDTTIGQFAVAIGDDEAAISSLIQTAEEIKGEVQELQNKSMNLADPDMWEQGTSSNEQAGKTYDETKVDDTKRIRTKGLIPITWDAYFTFTPDSNPFSVCVLYFTKDEVYNDPPYKTPAWTKLGEQTEGKLKITDTGVTEAQYIAIIIKKNDESEITIDDLKKVGLNLIVSEITSYSEFKMTSDEIKTTVSNNKKAADEAFKNIDEVVIPGLDGRLDNVEEESGNSASWISQNKDRILLISAQFDDEGNLSNTTGLVVTDDFASLFAAEYDATGAATDISQLKLDVSGLSTTVTDNKKAADDAFKTLNDEVIPDITDRLDDVEDESSNSASWISQNKDKISVVVANFDADGKPTQASGLVTTSTFSGLFTTAMSDNGVITFSSISTYIEDFVTEDDVESLISVAEITADKIKFNVTFDWTVKNSNDETIFNLDSNGNLTISGDFNGGKISKDVTVGTQGQKIYIYVDENDGTLIRSGLRGTDPTYGRMFDLGFEKSGSNTYPTLYMSYGSASSATSMPSTYLTPGRLQLRAASSGNIFRFGVDSNGKLDFYAQAWLDTNTATSGQVYRDTNGYLRVK